MLINISSNNVTISSAGEIREIQRGGLEIELPKVLKELYDWGHVGNTIYVINGPGSFTNLRVGCLCLNMLKDIVNYKKDEVIQLTTIDKISLYTNLNKEKIIWSRWLLYIGQQKNAWSLDCDLGAIDKVTLQDDASYERIDWYDGFPEDKRVVKFLLKDGVIEVYCDGNVHYCDPLELWFAKVDLLVPHYMIEPNITLKGQ